MSTSHASGGSSPFTINRFIIKEQIGSGTFGIVYRAIEKYSEK
jgi:serine/threonine protein kinase